MTVDRQRTDERDDPLTKRDLGSRSQADLLRRSCNQAVLAQNGGQSADSRPLLPLADSRAHDARWIAFMADRAAARAAVGDWLGGGG